ncbi:MAG: hypothetical protein J6C87_03550 [Bacteroides sp.]|nr:hypothetical protein [Bacteroides sp.]
MHRKSRLVCFRNKPPEQIVPAPPTFFTRNKPTEEADVTTERFKSLGRKI